MTIFEPFPTKTDHFGRYLHRFVAKTFHFAWLLQPSGTNMLHVDDCFSDKIKIDAKDKLKKTGSRQTHHRQAEMQLDAGRLVQAHEYKMQIGRC